MFILLDDLLCSIEPLTLSYVLFLVALPDCNCWYDNLLRIEPIEVSFQYKDEFFTEYLKTQANFVDYWLIPTNLKHTIDSLAQKHLEDMITIILNA